MQIYR